MPDDISPMAAVRDQTLKAKFRGGEDWKCKFCSSSQFRVDGTCARCGASQEETVAPEKARKRYAPAPQPTKPVPAASVYRTASPPPPEHVPDSTPDSIPFNKFSLYDRFWAPGGPRRLTVVFLVTILFLFLCYFLFSTHEVEARVESVSWKRTVEVQRYQIYQHEGWTPHPSSISTKNLGSRIHHYDHVAVGSHSEPYTDRYPCGEDCVTVKGSCYTTSRSCSSNKNGSATCSGGDRVCSSDTRSCSTRYCTRILHRTVTDYEDQPRYQDWYSWKVWEWGHNRFLTSSGTTTEVTDPSESVLPTLAQSEKERLLPPMTEYHVHLVGGKESIDYDPGSEVEFSRFNPRSSHSFRVGILRSTELIR